jgi:hypothetical protein
MTLAPQDILGFWTLRSWDILNQMGGSQPYEDTPVSGFLHYGADGKMSVSLFCQDNAKLITTYGGNYELQHDHVVHMPAVGYSPQGIHSAKRRFLRLEKGDLVMETDWMSTDDKTEMYRLIWAKST